MPRLLIVDDDVELCELVVEYLGSEGFEVEAVHDGVRGVERALAGDVDVVVLDVMLPGMNGLDTLRAIRARSSVPVIMLTARGEGVDRIVGLEIGADDYVPKPFIARELLARVRAVLRRAAPVDVRDAVTVGDVSLDRGARTVVRDAETVELTSVEFDLLDALLRAAGTVVSRYDLALAALGREISPLDRAVDQHVSNLRRKLGPRERGTERIKSVRGSGYVYTLPPAPEP